MKQSVFSFLISAALLGMMSSCTGVVSCSNDNKAQSETITVLNWNLETFFDASFDGNEYTEFKNGKSGWSREKYETRLDRLASVIKTLDADVLVFEELEKEAQLYDITNRLSGTFNFSKLYSHAFFATDQGASIGCGVLSRLPIGEISIHSLDVRTAGADQPSMRPILQFSVFAGDAGATSAAGGKKLVVFANHWKSKSGDTNGDTARWRRLQESVLCRCMRDVVERAKLPVLACGDFNMDVLEFASYAGSPVGAASSETDGSSGEKLSYAANVLLRGGIAAGTAGATDAGGVGGLADGDARNLPVYSPWFDAQGNLVEPGSYWYNDAWERIDHFFAAGRVTVSAFGAKTNGAWATSSGKPIRYQVYNGAGYSDHLPIMCSVRF